MKTYGGTVPPSAPWRLTRRGRALLTVTCVALGAVLLALAYQTGQDARCDALRTAHDPNASRYCS